MTEYFTCPVCGTAVPAKAKACPECGSDSETGWSETAQFSPLFPDRDDENTPPQRTLWQTVVMPIAALLCLMGFLAATGAYWMAILVPVLAGVVRFSGALRRWLKHQFPALGSSRQAYRQLLRRAGGDRALADRLITYEQHRTPTATRLQLIQAAIFRWDRDRRS